MGITNPIGQLNNQPIETPKASRNSSGVSTSTNAKVISAKSRMIAIAPAMMS